MSRYYRIEVTDTDGNPVQFSSFGNTLPIGLAPSGQQLEPGVITSLLADGTTNPAALNVEIDVTQQAQHIGDTRSYVRIYGLGLKDIFSKDFNNQNIAVSVGMAKGLPLADPSQQGLVVKGAIWQAFGNWLGTDMTLDLVIGSGGLTGTPDANQRQPYVFTWKKGQTLQDAITQTIQNVPPLEKLKQNFSISDDRTARDDISGYYFTLTEFAQLIQHMTAGQRGTNDNGVWIATDGQTISVKDTSEQTDSGNIKQIRFQDMIGQVTWFAPFQLTCKLVMRGDLQLFDKVRFPQGATIQTTAAAMPGTIPSRDRDTLGIAQGEFQVQSIHHWGNYRQPDAMAWNTTLQLLQTK